MLSTPSSLLNFHIILFQPQVNQTSKFSFNVKEMIANFYQSNHRQSIIYINTIKANRPPMRSLITTSIRMIRPSLTLIPQPISYTSSLHTPLRFCFAKISKKQQQRSEKKKEKSQAKEALGGDTAEIDLNKYEQAYSAVVASYKEQLATIRFGRLDVSAVSLTQIKLGSETLPLNSLAQVSAKSANSCVVSPFDSDHIDPIQRSLRIWDDSLDIKRGETTLTLTQATQGKQVRDKLVQRVKKLGNDRKEQLKKIRSNTQDELRKYKKIVPEDRLRIIENEAKALFEKKGQEIDKLEKEKEKELLK